MSSPVRWAIIVTGLIYVGWALEQAEPRAGVTFVVAAVAVGRFVYLACRDDED